jgi:hypothetical protein
MTMRSGVRVVACAVLVGGALTGGCFVAPRDTPVGAMNGGPDGGGSHGGDGGAGGDGDGDAGGGYEFGGCENKDYGCPRLPTFYCAAEAIRLAHAGGCTVDTDCALAQVGSACTGFGSCGLPAVRTSQVAAYQAAFAAEAAVYCASNGGCHTAGQCAYPESAFAAACLQQTCQTIRLEAAIAPPPPLADALCEWTPPDAPSACTDPKECLVLHRKGAAPLVVLPASALGEDSFHYAPLVTDAQVFFTTYRSTFAPPGPARFVALPALGGPLTDLLTLPSDSTVSDIGAPAWDPSYGLWFVPHVTGAGAEQSVRVATTAGMTMSHSIVAYPNVSSPTSNGVALGSDYFVAHADGLWSYYPAGGSRVAAIPGIVSIAGDDEHVVFSACDQGSLGPCTLYRYDRAGGAVQALLGPIGEDLRTVALEGNAAYAISGRRLRRVPLGGGPAEVLYQGDGFPQHTGTLSSRTLKVAGNKVYLGQICHFDADAPGYGTVELDLDAATARWLNADPDFPYVPQLVPYHGWETWPLRNAHGLYVWQSPSPP